MRELSMSARVFVMGVLTAALIVLIDAVRHLDSGQWLPVAVLAAIIVASESLGQSLSPKDLAGSSVAISTTMPLATASLLIFGPWGAAVCAVASGLVATRMSLTKRLFNAGQTVLAVFCAGQFYLLIGGQVPLTRDSFPLAIVQVLAANMVYELINGLLIIGIVSLAERVSPHRVWVGTMAQSALPYFVYSIFGLLLAVIWSSGVGPFSVVLVLAPLFVARWVFAQFAAKREAYEATIRTLIQAVETKDVYTRGHSQRVSRGSVLVGRQRGLREDRLTLLRYAGMLHDVGKLGVPTSVLVKAGQLTAEEFESIKMHPVWGREIVRDLEFLGEAIPGIYHHHERMDGRGYPLGLRGPEIPEFARMIAVADAFDAMTTTRSYRRARGNDEAIEELRRCQGTQFDPVMVQALADGLAQEGWDVADTLPDEVLEPTSDVPSYGTDDDDPTAVSALGLTGSRPYAGNGDGSAESRSNGGPS
jgi:hypothetical protein